MIEQWNAGIDSRHSLQMHRYLVFAICSSEGPPVALPFSRQKVSISPALAFKLVFINGKMAASLEVSWSLLSCLWAFP